MCGMKVLLRRAYTVKPEILVAIIFGGFENITIWRSYNLEILLEESVHIFFIWRLLILAKFTKKFAIFAK